MSYADPHLVVRCARHYERAAAVVVSAAVLTASLFVEPPPPAWSLSRAEESFQDTPGDGSAGADGPAAEGEGAGNEDEEQEGGRQQQQQQQREREERQAKQLSERISRMNPREQAMARHSQVLVNHHRLVADNAEQTRRRYQEERQRWQQQQQQQQQQQALPVGATVTSRAAARIDLAGGWTDTPPISYEAGGSVVNVAVTVSGERPVEARCERIEACGVELVCKGRDGTVTSRTVCSSLRDFE